MLAKSFFQQSGSVFTVDVPASAILDAVAKREPVDGWKPSFTYRVTQVAFDGGTRYSWFIEARRERGYDYLGTLDQHTGTVRLTNGSRGFANEQPVVRVVQRVVKAIYEGRGSAVEAAGWNVREGHTPAPQGEVATPAVETPKLAGPLRFLADIFTVAIGYGLKKPMLRVHFKDRRFKFYLSRRGTICLKTGALVDNAETGSRDPIGDEEYAGCLVRGEFRPAKRFDYQYGRTETTRELLPVEAEFLERLAKDAVGFIAACGKDMCRCCYCNQPLEDAKSKKVGYGPVCAKRWGLPWGDGKAVENAPSFAKCYDDHAAGLLNAIRDDQSGDNTRWMIFADWLQEHDLPRCEVPKKGVQLPRND